MNHDRIFKTSTSNANEYYQSIPITKNYIMNPRLKKKQFKNNNPLYLNYSQPSNKNKYSYLGNSYLKNISHRDFHKNVHIENYSHKPYSNNFKYDFLKEKRLFKNYYRSTILENDMDIMKIQMSCDLITHKINQIKNKVQDLHESSIQDDKYILNKNSKNKDKFNKIGNLSEHRKIFELNKSNNSLTDYHHKYNYNNPSFQRIDDYSTRINNTINSYINYEQNNINRFRKIKINCKTIPNLAINQNNKKYHSGKNSLKYILLNSSNINKKTSIPINDKNTSYNINNMNNSNLLTDVNYLNKISNNFNLLNNKIIEAYSTKQKHPIIRNENNNKKNITNNQKLNVDKKSIINYKKALRRNNRNIMNDNLSSSNEIKFGSFDKYFINNNNYNYEKKSYKNNNNRLLYNKSHNLNNNRNLFYNKDKVEQIKNINKILNKNKIIRNNNLNNKEKYHKLNKNKINYNINAEAIECNHNSNKILTNNNNIYKNYNKIKHKNIGSDISKGMNYNYYVNKEGNIVQNNYINNNFGSQKNQKKNNNKQIKRYRNIILNYNKSNEVQSKTKINNTKDTNYKININNISNYSIQNYSLNILNNSIKSKKNDFKKESKMKSNIEDLNNTENTNNNNKKNNERTKEEINLRNNYSKDDILRNSERIYNINDNINRDIISGKDNTNGEQKENIFDLILKENNDEIKENSNNIKKEKKFIINNSDNNKINKSIYFDKNKILNNNLKLNNLRDMKGINEDKSKIDKNPNINIKNIIKYKEKKIRPKDKELCHKFTGNPQHFFTIKLNELMLNALNIKKNK